MQGFRNQNINHVVSVINPARITRERERERERKRERERERLTDSQTDRQIDRYRL